MADDLTKTGPQDGQQINLKQKHEVVYWTKKLRITTSQLVAAVHAAGPYVDKVKDHLKKK